MGMNDILLLPKYLPKSVSIFAPIKSSLNLFFDQCDAFFSDLKQIQDSCDKIYGEKKKKANLNANI